MHIRKNDRASILATWRGAAIFYPYSEKEYRLSLPCWSIDRIINLTALAYLFLAGRKTKCGRAFSANIYDILFLSLFLSFSTPCLFPIYYFFFSGLPSSLILFSIFPSLFLSLSFPIRSRLFFLPSSISFLFWPFPHLHWTIDQRLPTFHVWP